MELLPKWVLPPTMPSIYETESFTALEMVAKVYGAMNELITEYNKFVDSVNTQMETFTAETEEQYNLFAVGLRQEFQDFIDVVDIKIKSLEEKVTETSADIVKAVNDAIARGDVYIVEEYDPETESLNLIVGGEA